jgi:hypothetical protein
VIGRMPELGDGMALAEGILAWTISESRVDPGEHKSPVGANQGAEDWADRAP